MQPIPIVGSHFHPPAKEVLQCLPSGTTLVLVADPSNPYDDKAIRVYVNLTQCFEDEEVIQERLDAACECRGYTGAELMGEQRPCFLGFIPKSGGKTAEGGPGNMEVWKAFGEALSGAGLVVELGFTPDGKPCVCFDSANELDESCVEWSAEAPFNE